MKRLDHHAMWIWVMGALIPLCALLIGFYAPLPAEGRLLFTLCDLTGSTACVLGMITGTRFFFPGVDPRLPYAMGISGAGAIFVGLVVQTLGMLTADQWWARMLLVSAACLIGGTTQSIVALIREIRRLTRELDGKGD